MTSRILKISSLVVLGVLLSVTSVTWIRSYYHADRVHGRLVGHGAFLIGAKQGRVVIAGFRAHGNPGWWPWDVGSYPVDDSMSFPVGPVEQYEAKLGVGWIETPLYFVMPPQQKLPDGRSIMLWGAATATLQGGALLIPHWLIALLTGSAILFLVQGRTFSLRVLMIWFTVVIFVLALALHADLRRHSSNGKHAPSDDLPRPRADGEFTLPSLPPLFDR